MVELMKSMTIFLLVYALLLLSLYSIWLTKHTLALKEKVKYYEKLEIPRLKANISELINKRFNLKPREENE